MKLNKAINYALDGKAVLFLGSGFSFGSENYRGNTPRTGSKLAGYLCECCGYKDDVIPLEDISQEYIRQNGPDALVDFLKEEYSIKKTSTSHVTIMGIPWMRVYTTNWDTCAEQAYSECHRYDQYPVMESATPSETPGGVLHKPVCVHLNGCISSLTHEKLYNEFRMTDQSYVSDSLLKSNWFRQFIQDIRCAKAIIIIGYSMSFDLDIKRHLSSPEIKNKVVFITKEDDRQYNIAKLRGIWRMQGCWGGCFIQKNNG